MLSKRIIPCLDVDRGRVVKGVKFFDHVDAGDPVEQARRYDQQGADELVFYDISASHEGRDIMRELVSKVVEVIFMPLTVGGGIRTLDDAVSLIQAGAEKVSVNSAAVKRPQLIREISGRFGMCATVLGLDANRVIRPAGTVTPVDGVDGSLALVPRRTFTDASGQPMEEVWEVFVGGGRVATGVDVMAWCKLAVELGVGEIVLNVMNADGTTAGYDLEMTRAVSTDVSVPVVASGGAGNAQHVYDVLTEGKADAALAASIFHFGTTTVGDVKRFLAQKSMPVRINSP